MVVVGFVVAAVVGRVADLVYCRYIGERERLAVLVLAVVAALHIDLRLPFRLLLAPEVLSPSWR